MNLLEKVARVTREVDGGLQTIEVTLPSIISVDLRLNEPRYASLPNIMKAKKKPLEILSPQELKVDVSPRLTILSTEEPKERSAGIILDNIDDLAEKIKTEAGV